MKTIPRFFRISYYDEIECYTPAPGERDVRNAPFWCENGKGNRTGTLVKDSGGRELRMRQGVGKGASSNDKWSRPLGSGSGSGGDAASGGLVSNGVGDGTVSQSIDIETNFVN